MKAYLSILSASALLFVACTQNKPKETTETTATKAKVCYLAISGQDSAKMSIDETEVGVTGALAFNFLEKKDLNGEIKGFFSGDTLFVDYTFKLEGTVSKNPLVFLRKGDTLQQGNGIVETYLGKTHFKDHSVIKFKEGFLFKPTDCD